VKAGAEGEPGADGALIVRGDVHRSPVLIVGVDDVDESIARIEAAGGTIVQGRMPVPGVGWSAYFTDPEGNTVGLFQPDESAT
jgi:predicted enzyme related to lactoylglutathione lyase